MYKLIIIAVVLLASCYKSTEERMLYFINTSPKPITVMCPSLNKHTQAYDCYLTDAEGTIKFFKAVAPPVAKGHGIIEEHGVIDDGSF